MSYHNKETGWCLAAMDFFPDLTLLVGVSGAGKTRILEALSTLKKIVKGEDHSSRWGLEWNITFRSAGQQFCWTGEFERRGTATGVLTSGSIDGARTELPRRKTGPKVLRERLTSEGKVIVERDSENILLNEELTPKLTPFESVLNILSLEDAIRPASVGFSSVVDDQKSDSNVRKLFFVLEDLYNKYDTLETIRESDLPTYAKLVLVQNRAPDVFRQIVNRFQQVFPQVEDIRFESIVHEPFSNVPDLRIKERDVEDWIPEDKVSSGMFRTLIHLSSILLWPHEAVILIDEFENSLGINCLDFVTQRMMDESRHLQLVITSHHPYIINHISSTHWKIVTRKGSVVTAHNASEFGIGRSRHEAFIQLINNNQYREGIATG